MSAPTPRMITARPESASIVLAADGADLARITVRQALLLVERLAEILAQRERGA